MHLLLGWRTRLEAETVQSGNSLVRTGCAWAEGVCCLQNPPLSLPQTQPEAQSTIPGPALPACCTVLAPALSGQGTTPCQRSCSFLRDEHSSFLELPELCHWVMAPSTDVLWRQKAAIWAPPWVLQGTELYHTVIHITEAGRLLSTLWDCYRQGLFESCCLIISYINRTNPSLPWGRSCCFIHVAKRTKSQITSLSLSEPPHLAGQPQACIHKELETELGTRAADTYLKP